MRICVGRLGNFVEDFGEYVEIVCFICADIANAEESAMGVSYTDSQVLYSVQCQICEVLHFLSYSVSSSLARGARSSQHINKSPSASSVS
jgi:hypothetical protein